MESGFLLLIAGIYAIGCSLGMLHWSEKSDRRRLGGGMIPA